MSHFFPIRVVEIVDKATVDSHSWTVRIVCGLFGFWEKVNVETWSLRASCFLVIVRLGNFALTKLLFVWVSFLSENGLSWSKWMHKFCLMREFVLGLFLCAYDPVYSGFLDFARKFDYLLLLLWNSCYKILLVSFCFNTHSFCYSISSQGQVFHRLILKSWVHITSSSILLFYFLWILC